MLLGLGLALLWWARENGRPSPTYLHMTVEIAPDLVERAQASKTLFFIFTEEPSPSSPVWISYRERLKAPLSHAEEFYFRKENIQLYKGAWREMPPLLHVKLRLDRDGLAGPDQVGDIIGFVAQQSLGSATRIILDTLVTEPPTDPKSGQWEQLKAWNPKILDRDLLFGVPKEGAFPEMKTWIDPQDLKTQFHDRTGV